MRRDEDSRSSFYLSKIVGINKIDLPFISPSLPNQLTSTIIKCFGISLNTIAISYTVRSGIIVGMWRLLDGLIQLLCSSSIYELGGRIESYYLTPKEREREHT